MFYAQDELHQGHLGLLKYVLKFKSYPLPFLDSKNDYTK